MMLFFKRIIATICDITLIFILVSLLIKLIDPILNIFFKDETLLSIGTLFSVIYIIISYLILLIAQIFIGTSIGKWLLNLKLITYNNFKPSPLKLILRDFLKFMPIFTILGIIITIVLYFTGKIMWYDKMLGFDIEDTKSKKRNLSDMFR